MSNIKSLPRLLIVDDSRMVRAMLVKHIKGYYDYREEADGEAAWHTLLLDQSIKAVISDLTMPVLDGYGLLERIRKSKISRIRNLPVIMISGDEDEDSRKHAREVGASDFITKGVGFTELMGRLEALMEPEPHEQPAVVTVADTVAQAPQAPAEPEIMIKSGTILLGAGPDAEFGKTSQEDTLRIAEVTADKIESPLEFTESAPATLAAKEVHDDFDVIEIPEVPDLIEFPDMSGDIAADTDAVAETGMAEADQEKTQAIMEDTSSVYTEVLAESSAVKEPVAVEETAEAQQRVSEEVAATQESEETKTPTEAMPDSAAAMPDSTEAMPDSAAAVTTSAEEVVADSLQAATGLYNREYVEVQLANAFTHANKTQKEISVLVLGFDHYHDLCQKHGVQSINQLIIRFSRLLYGKVRPEDILGNFAEAQFVVISPGTPARQCLAFAAKVREAIETANISLQGNAVRLTVSVGVANTAIDKSCKDAVSLMQTAARRMHRVMAAGGNRVLGPEEMATLRSDMVNLERALAILDMKQPEALASRAIPIAQRLMPLLQYLDHELRLDLPLEKIEQKIKDMAKMLNI